MAKMNILRIDASARKEGSITRQLADRFIAGLYETRQAGSIVVRDTNTGLDFVSEAWMNANFTEESERTQEHKAVLAASDQMVAELEAADLLVIGVPIYNFGIPASLKAWVDMIARARKTFKYTENGPVGLLENKRAVLIVASGGTEAGSAIDFASGYMKHVLGFIGIHEVEIIAADRLMVDADASMQAANARITELTQPRAA
ncbi:MAG: NAD(P)H-dependent oxidoreductase [Pseudomonadota bacterium]